VADIFLREFVPTYTTGFPDSAAFDAKAYYEQLITTASLPALLKKENELLTGAFSHLRSLCDSHVSSPVEIRELDSERQSLVYNHHHELIAASDTIAAVRVILIASSRQRRIYRHLWQMKARAENLDADMDLLKAAFSEISRLSTEVAQETERLVT
jgi:vacuolar protein sorting-associated protein 51